MICAISICVALFIIIIIKSNRKHIDDIVNKDELPYKKNNYILSISEKNFYQVLKTALKDTEYFICIKIRLDNVLYVKGNNKSFTNKIRNRQIDFLICNDNIYFNPILAIELDDKSSNSIDKLVIDKFIERVYKSAKLSFLRVNTDYPYSTNELREEIQKLVEDCQINDKITI